MSNKEAGTRFEKEFAARLAAEGFWVHRFQDNKNGQPCDMIAARDGNAYLFDCKDCQRDVFDLRRMEENQYNTMQLFLTTGNSRGMFAVRYPDKNIHLIDFQIIQQLKKDGRMSITVHDMPTYGRTLESWLNEIETVRGDSNDYRNWL